MTDQASSVPKDKEHTVSFFEFWPGWILYIPVVIQWIVLAVRYGSLTLPFLANPSLRLSGMVGVGKTELMNQASGKAAEAILPWIAYRVTDQPISEQTKACLNKAADKGINLPFACKPDIGCRGVGVKLVKTIEQLETIVAMYPEGAVLLCQKLALSEPEVGIFYTRDPESGAVSIPSMTIKTLPRITGDGVQTLGQLIAKDSRAGQLQHLYEDRHRDIWDTVPEKGEVIRLVFSASHSKGAIFEDARAHITPELTDVIDGIMKDIPDFYYGRLDVKFPDIESLKKGQGLEVVEINGASAESIHIWDKDAKLIDAIKALMWQYRTLFKFGAIHRKQGKKPPSIRDLWNGWQLERRLTNSYPLTD